MNIRVYIERVVVDSSLALDSGALKAALIEGLSMAMVRPAGLALLQHSGAIVDAGVGSPIHFERPDCGWSRQIAGALHGALAGCAQAADAPAGGTP